MVLPKSLFRCFLYFIIIDVASYIYIYILMTYYERASLAQFSVYYDWCVTIVVK